VPKIVDDVLETGSGSHPFAKMVAESRPPPRASPQNCPRVSPQDCIHRPRSLAPMRHRGIGTIGGGTMAPMAIAPFGPSLCPLCPYASGRAITCGPRNRSRCLTGHLFAREDEATGARAYELHEASWLRIGDHVPADRATRAPAQRGQPPEGMPADPLDAVIFRSRFEPKVESFTLAWHCCELIGHGRRSKGAGSVRNSLFPTTGHFSPHLRPIILIGLLLSTAPASYPRRYLIPDYRGYI
jgi:hypothetical protein